jgi:hypothetical protein
LGRRWSRQRNRTARRDTWRARPFRPRLSVGGFGV